MIRYTQTLTTELPVSAARLIGFLQDPHKFFNVTTKVREAPTDRDGIWKRKWCSHMAPRV